MGIAGWSAEEVTDEDCQYTRLPDGGWEWPLWEWKGAILQESGCAYGKFFKDKAAFISRKMRSRFDAYLTRLEMGGYIVTEDFIYPLDRHGREYGWGWSLLTTPERLFGREACHPDRSPQESHERMLIQFRKILPHESEKTYAALLK